MKLKLRPTDFKVREILRDDVLAAKGEFRVYAVTKRKLTSLEAAEILADHAGVAAGEVAMAGLKDRQGVTTQHMTIRRGREVRFGRPEIGIESIGFAPRDLTSEDSAGNAFEIIVRDLDERETNRVRTALPSVREHGLPNYFDDQRFGNLRHGQGWIALELMRGRTEVALKRLLCNVSDHDNDRMKGFKSALFRHWGDWGTCRDVAGRFGAHHSVFEHLRKNEGDFAGAFRFIASRIRLIHLYAWQSHVWNRAVARGLENAVDENERFAIHTREGKHLFPKGEVPVDPEWEGTFPLPGPALEGVRFERQRELIEEVLTGHDLAPDAFRIDGVPGFALKPEERPIVVRPENLRVRPAEPDPTSRGRKLVKLSFALPRGAYASLVVRRLVGPPGPSSGSRADRFSSGARDSGGSGTRRRGRRRR